jgi:hypothetical protein
MSYALALPNAMFYVVLMWWDSDSDSECGAEEEP